MYFEEATVKEYYRKNKEGNKKAFNQINLGFRSNFQKEEAVVILTKETFEKITAEANPETITEIKAATEKIAIENDKLNQELQAMQEENLQLTEEVSDLTEEISKLKTDLIEANDKITNSKEEIIQLQKEHKEEIAEARKETLEFSKAINYIMNRNLFSRIRNSIPKEVNVLKLDTSEEVIEVNDN